jgi:exosortase
MQRHDRALLLATLVAAVWPVWRWTTLRLIDGSDGTWELLAAITAVVLLVRDRDLRPAKADLSLTIALLISYAAAYAFVSPLVRGVLAMAAIGSMVSSLWYGKRIELSVCGLLLISLPVMASLNFYLGYPLRVVAGTFTEFLLQANGIAATREGALLVWNGKSIAIDAPCSGVRMLWTGAYLCFSLAALMRLNAARTIALGGATLIVVIAANALRATSLFYVEAQLIAAPDFMHDAVGLVMFVFAAVAVFLMSQQLASERHA